jgi:hypothetical protein
MRQGCSVVQVIPCTSDDGLRGSVKQVASLMPCLKMLRKAFEEILHRCNDRMKLQIKDQEWRESVCLRV